MNIPFYENKIPSVNENVLVIFTEYKSTHIEANLVEYKMLSGMMTYEDATRKKKVYDWKKEIPLNKLIVAKVEEIFSDNYVKLSTRYFDNRKSLEILNKELMSPFNDNKTLLNIVKKTCYNSIDVDEFWTSIIYKIDALRKDDNFIDISILEFINSNINIVNNIIKEKYDNSIVTKFNQLLHYKTSKIQTKISITTKKNIDNIKNLITFVSNKSNNWNYTLKYVSAPNYILESSSDTCDLSSNHQDFVVMLKNYCKEYDTQVF